MTDVDYVWCGQKEYKLQHCWQADYWVLKNREWEKSGGILHGPIPNVLILRHQLLRDQFFTSIIIWNFIVVNL